MCGRYSLVTPAEELMAAFGLSALPKLAPRVNIAPGTPVAAVRPSPASGERELTHFLWGLIPAWAREAKPGQGMINARCETLAEKPSFKNAYRRRRCLLPADGFFEWPRGSGPRQPYRIAPRQGGLVAFAGIWETWKGPNGEELETCAIVTTQAVGRMAKLHPRSPVMLEAAAWEAWLDHNQPRQVLESFFKSWDDEMLTIHPVDRAINDPANQDARLLEPVEAETAPEPRQGSLF